MDYVKTKQDLAKVLTTDVLPESDFEHIEPNKNGVTAIDDYIQTSVELPDSKKIYQHEKTSTSRIFVKSKKIITPENGSILNPKYHSYYFKPTQSKTIHSFYDDVLAQSVLELYPTPLASYATILNPYGISTWGNSVVDLNHLKSKAGEHIASIRFDMLLNKLGLGKDINSFADLQEFINNENVLKFLTPEAVLQVALCTYFIPNIIGETDANSRNIILLFNPEKQKYDIVVRIDAEANTYINQVNGTRSGKREIPKGIFLANERYEEEFLKNIKEKDSKIDWDLFDGLLELASEFLTRSKIDDAISNRGYRRNLFRAKEDMFCFSPAGKHLDALTYAEFSDATINRAFQKLADIKSCLRGSTEKIPFIRDIENRKKEKLEMEDFDRTGKIMQ